MTPERPVVLVTGTSRGIGSHLARHFVERDFTVIGCSRSGYEGIDDPRYVHHVVDVGVEADVLRLFRAIRLEHGRLDVVVNNAAVNPTLSLLAMTTSTAAGEALATNLLGPFLVCREAVKLMLRRRYGRIVNFGSIATRFDPAGDAVYSACKAGVNALTRSLAKEVGGQGITCNVVAPAAFDTELAAVLDPERGRALLEGTALPAEFGSFEELSAVVDWLTSPEAAGVTAQVVYLGGA